MLNNVRVGHLFEPFSIERMTPNRFMTFMERGLPDQPFAPARNLGVQCFDWSEAENATWALGVFRTDSNVFGDDSGDNGEKSLTGRATLLPWYDEPSDGRYYVHLGAGYSYRDTNGDSVRFQSQPEARVGGRRLPMCPILSIRGRWRRIAFNFWGWRPPGSTGRFRS